MKTEAEERMKNILEFIAEIEWIVLGVLVFWCLRHWNRRFSELYDELRNEIGGEGNEQ